MKQPGTTRDKFLEAARKVLIKKGNSASVSTIDICAAAKYTRPTFYQHFSGKQQLLTAVIVASLERDLKPYLEKAFSISDPEERLRFMARTYTRDIICAFPELKVIIHDSLNAKDKHLREVRVEWERHYQLLTSTIEEIQNTGKISPDIKPSWAALFLLGMLTWTTYWFDFNRKSNNEAITDLAEKLVFNTLGLNS